MSDNAIFVTQRKKILEAYKQSGEAFSASTKPYKSTVSFMYQSAVLLSVSSVQWMVAPQGQRLEWFSYKLADQVPGNSAAYRSALEDDTNLSKSRTTNGAEDFVIEGLSATCRSIRPSFGLEAPTVSSTSYTTEVAQALTGLVPTMDPAAIYFAPQCFSPFNLEQMLYRAIVGHIAVEFEWDRNKVVKIGTLDQIPEGAGNSYLRAFGEPSTNDRYRIPEGYLWRREGQPDSEFITRGTLAEPVALPFLMVTPPNNTTSLALVNLDNVRVDVVMRLHGLSVKLPSRN